MRWYSKVARAVTRVGGLALTWLVLGAAPMDAQVSSPIQPFHYVPGVINIRDAVTPPPGLFVSWYNWALSSDTYIGSITNAQSPR